MFNGCRQLKNITVAFTAWETDPVNAPHPYTENWVEGVAEEGTFNGPILLPLKEGESYMPKWNTTSAFFYLAANEDGTEVSFNKNGSPTGVIYYYKEGDAVELLIQHKTDLGFKAIVDNQYTGLLYDNEIFRPLHTGDHVQGFIKQIRPDGKLDLTLQNAHGREQVEGFSQQLLKYLQETNSYLHHQNQT